VLFPEICFSFKFMLKMDREEKVVLGTCQVYQVSSVESKVSICTGEGNGMEFQLGRFIFLQSPISNALHQYSFPNI
jgi:hypothetical protein